MRYILNTSLLLFILLSSCAKRQDNLIIYKEFTNSEWQRFEYLEGDIEITKTPAKYDLVMEIVVSDKYPSDYVHQQKDGSFLVSREKYDNFTLDDLKGKTVIGGRTGGMPEMTFEWALRQNGIDPKKDVNIDTSVAFAAMEGAFIGGSGDFVTLFEPNATSVVKNGFGHIVAYVGELGGNVPYTAYNARKSYIEKNKDVIEKFTRAINRGLEYVSNHSARDVAKIINGQFPDTSLNDMEIIVNRYKEGEAWKKNITITEEEWIHIQDIMIASLQLDDYVEYDKLIFDEFFKDYE